jgi:hypothetical protein
MLLQRTGFTTAYFGWECDLLNTDNRRSVNNVINIQLKRAEDMQ